jgi:flagellar assembly factor FliW
VEFPQGLIGFASAKQFVLIDEPSSERFMWLASVDHQPNLRFLVADPIHIVPDYRVKVEAGDLDFLHLSCAEDAEIFVIITVPKNAIEATANLQSPILINTKRRMGKQIILEQGRYPIQYAILKECASVNAGSER